MRLMYAAILGMSVSLVHAAELRPARVELSCHRTANEDVPENTLESLEQAALLGCDVVEVDIRHTLDGMLVLNHDGDLERLSDGIGQVETTYYDDLKMRDFGSWMNDRFRAMQIPLFEDALRLARDMKIRLYLDFKDKGMGADALLLLQREGMLDRVEFGGECDDIVRLAPGRKKRETAGVSPGVSVAEVQKLHATGKFVSANFSANGHGMDLAAMKVAVAAGVDGINVDYPRLGADAVGRPVEAKLAELARQAEAGDSLSRARAILALSRYRGFELEDQFARWLLDADDHVSRAAAVALVRARPQTHVAVFAKAILADHADVRANAAWALGAMRADVSTILPLLHDIDVRVQNEALAALAHMPGAVPAEALIPLLSSATPAIRGAAALALAKHQPEVASKALPLQLRSEVRDALGIFDEWTQRGKPPLTQQEIDRIVAYYLCQVQEVKAISMLDNSISMKVLEEQAFRPGKDFAEMNGILGAFQLWDRIGEDPQLAVQSLGAADPSVADRAEWMLVQAGRPVLPAVRKALESDQPAIRMRAIRIVGWQGDVAALPLLRALHTHDSSESELVNWAVEKINTLHPQTEAKPQVSR